jgi:cytochrome-b5 reductase
LVFGNRSVQDILLKSELDEFYKAQNFTFKLCYTINSKEAGWDGHTGHITKEMISETCPPPGENTLMLMCGPPAMCTSFLQPMLIEMGYSNEDIFEF